MDSASPATVDEYIASFPPEVEARMRSIRTVILAVAPDTQQRISYKIAGFFTKKGTLIYIAGWKKHIGMYPVTAPMLEAIPELADYKTSGRGTVQFAHNEPLPLELVRKIVEFRLAN
jgi:uncharacterized protein YdhG (YjbR/CyaY superfamily)